MTFVSKNAGNTKYKVDLSEGKYRSRRDGLLNILFHASELPNDLFVEMNLSYDYYRKLISDLLRLGLIKRVSQDGMAGYQLTLKGKNLTKTKINYLKYRPCVEEETDRHYTAKRRRRKRNFSYLYALFDRVGIITYEVFAKPSIQDVDVNGDKIYFYTALEFKRMIGIEATPFKGSNLLGFMIGKGKIISDYRSGFWMPVFGKHEKWIPEYVQRYFSTPLTTAIMICCSDSAVIHLFTQIIEGKSYDKKSVNTAGYKNFFILQSADDSFLSHLHDLYIDHIDTEQRLIERYRIDTSDKDANHRTRFLFGTGFIDDDPVLICAGNVNAVKLKYFVLNAGKTSRLSYILCRYRDLSVLQKITEGYPVKVLTISPFDD